MCFTIITTQLLPFSDGPKCVELHPIFQDAHIGIWVAGVVDETDIVRIGRGIQRQIVIEFDQVDDFLIAYQFARFPHGDDHATQVTDLSSGRNGLNRKGSFTSNAALGDAKRIDDPIIGSWDQAFFFFSWNIRERLKPMRISPFPH